MLIVGEVAPFLEKAGFHSIESFLDFSGGRRICHKRGRSVFRFEVGERAFYLKRNRFHWVEFWKRLSRFKLPRREALTEWNAINLVKAAGVGTVKPVAMGEKSWMGYETASFLLTEELYDAGSLEGTIKEKSGSWSKAQKLELIQKTARLINKLHGNGLYHQDLYLNHIFVGRESLFLLDLQRILKNPFLGEHYKVKDLGQLNYSTNYYGGFSRTEKLKFFLAYIGRKKLAPKDKALIKKIIKKTEKIAKHDVKLTVRRKKRGEM
jgi:lipopolysaccharide core heptose(I) kinase